jgi:hypothetical protein
VAVGVQVAVPAQDRVGRHHQSQVLQSRPGESAEQRGQPGPIGGLEPDPLFVELAVQHGELVPQGEDLRVLVPVTARQ